MAEEEGGPQNHHHRCVSLRCALNCGSSSPEPSSRCCRRPTDDKRLQNTLKRLGVNTIPGIEEVNLFKVRECHLVALLPWLSERPFMLRRTMAALSTSATRRVSPQTCLCALLDGRDLNLPLAVLWSVQASIAANTYVISGHAETKRLQDLLPGILNQVS